MPNPTGKGGFKERKHQINRDGRPKDAVSLAALVRRIGHEVATTKDGKPVLGPDGKPMTVVEVILRQKAQSVKGQAEFLDRGWGKVAQPLEVGGPNGGPIRTVTEVVIGGSQAPGQQAAGDVLDERST